jgi:hypothetical protein
LNGTLLTQSYAILRSFARRLSAYDGVTDEEKYLADIFCDLALDWRTLFVTSAFVNSVKGLNANEDSAPFANHKAFNLPSASLLSSSSTLALTQFGNWEQNTLKELKVIWLPIL